MLTWRVALANLALSGAGWCAGLLAPFTGCSGQQRSVAAENVRHAVSCSSALSFLHVTYDGGSGSGACSISWTEKDNMRSETEKQASSSKLQVRGPGHQAPGFELRSLSAGLRWRRMLTVTRSDETSKRVELIPRFHCWLRIVLGSQVDHTGVSQPLPRTLDSYPLLKPVISPG
jgi:hypothetical protein